MTLKVEDKAFFSKLRYTVLTLNIIDDDDNPPVFIEEPYVGHVDENSATNQTVAQVSAVDEDSGVNAEIRSDSQ